MLDSSILDLKELVKKSIETVEIFESNIRMYIALHFTVNIYNTGSV